MCLVLVVLFLFSFYFSPCVISKALCHWNEMAEREAKETRDRQQWGAGRILCFPLFPIETQGPKGGVHVRL